MIDFSTEFGQRTLERLQSEEFIWLTVVDDRGIAQPNPVWFIWQDDSLLIYSISDAKRLKHIAKRPTISLHFNANSLGEDVMVFTGETKVSNMESEPDPAYLEKYSDGIIRIGKTKQSFFELYSVEIRVYPKTLRGF